jgi:hypothetical protein
MSVRTWMPGMKPGMTIQSNLIMVCLRDAMQ